MTRVLELLDRLIALPTVSDRSNLELIDWAKTLLNQAGFEVTCIPSPDQTKAGLIATIGPKVAGGICLSAHTDVVPAAGQNWTYDPFKLTLQADRVFGRGVTDMKGFLASALALAEQADAAPLHHPLSIVLSYDEEVGCVGIREMLPALTPLMGAPRLVIVGEPTSMQVATGHKGKVALRVTCRGEAGHSALAPRFVNAIHVATDFVSEMRNLQAELTKAQQDAAYDIPYATVHVGKITGGRALNIVPDEVTLEMEFRHLADTPATKLIQLAQVAGERIGAAAGLADAITIEPLTAYPGLDVSAQDPVIALGRSLAGGTATTKVAFGTEAGFFADMDLDALVIGPGDMASDGHQPDEGLDVSQLKACEEMMARVLGQLTN